MKCRLVATTVALTLFSLALAPAGGGEELSARALKKLQKQADQAAGAGQLAEAVELYERFLAATPSDDPRRADALYTVAMAHLSPDPPPRDVEAGRQRLEELAASFPRHPRRLEIAAARASIAEHDAARSEIAGVRAELAEVRATFEAERQKITAERQEVAGESEAAGDQVRSLEVQLRQVRGQLAEIRAELEKKEEALQKLKDALVGRAGGSK